MRTGFDQFRKAFDLHLNAFLTYHQLFKYLPLAQYDRREHSDDLEEAKSEQEKEEQKLEDMPKPDHGFLRDLQKRWKKKLFWSIVIATLDGIVAFGVFQLVGHDLNASIVLSLGLGILLVKSADAVNYCMNLSIPKWHRFLLIALILVDAERNNIPLKEL